MKQTYRKSKNIQDLRDKPQRPGGNPTPTKAKKAHETLAKLTRAADNSGPLKGKERLKDVPTTPTTFAINRMKNHQREGVYANKMAKMIKDKDLGGKPTSFVKPKVKTTKRKGRSTKSLLDRQN